MKLRGTSRLSRLQISQSIVIFYAKEQGEFREKRGTLLQPSRTLLNSSERLKSKTALDTSAFCMLAVPLLDGQVRPL